MSSLGQEAWSQYHRRSPSDSLLGKVESDWIDNPNRETEAIFVTYEEFVLIAQRLKDKLLRGAIVPSSEGEIPELMYSEASA